MKEFLKEFVWSDCFFFGIDFVGKCFNVNANTKILCLCEIFTPVLEAL